MYLPLRLIVVLHMLQILPFLVHPPFDTTIEYQALHISVCFVVDVVGEPCCCAVASAA